VLAEIGADISGETPRPIDPELLRTVDLVVTLGREAVVEVPSGVELRNWDTGEPSERGTDGIERMRLVRDDINARVHELLTELAPTVTQRAELETVMSDFIHWACLGVRMVSVQPTPDRGVDVAVHRFEPWMMRAMRNRYDFPGICRPQETACLSAA
jgi:hypothetical protein